MTIKRFKKSTSISKKSIVAMAVAAAAGALGLRPAHAAPIYWTGGTSTTWGTNTNWNGNVTPTSSNDVGFDSTQFAYTNQPSTDAGGDSVLGIFFGNSGGAASTGTTLGGAGTLTIGTDGITMYANTGATTISAPIALGGTQTWTNNSTNLFTVSGNITSGAAGTQILTLAGTGNTSIGGNIGGGTGTIALTKSGSGILTLTGSNTYAGGTTISGGAISIGAATNLPSGSALTLATGGALNMTAAMTLANNVTIASGDSGILRYSAASGNMNLTGSMAGVAGTLTLDLSSATSFGGFNITGTGFALGSTVNMTKTGSANALVVLNAAATQTVYANTTVNMSATAGELVFFLGNNVSGLTQQVGALSGGSAFTDLRSDNQSNTLQINGIASASFAGIIADGSHGQIALVKTGAGTQTLSGANTYTGSTTVSNGVLNVTGAINGGNTVNVGQITVADGAANAVLTINGGTVLATKTAAPSLVIGGSAGTGAGAVVINSGTLTTNTEIWIGTDNTTANFGALLINGGTVTSGSYLALGRGNAANAAMTSRGELVMTNGALTVSTNNLEIGSFQLAPSSTDVMSMSGGTVSVTAGNVYAGQAESGILDMSGGTITTATVTNGLKFNNSGNAAQSSIVNLRSGTMTVGFVSTGGGSSIFNFSGGTLKASQSNTTFFTGLTNAYVYSGNGTIDNNGKVITIGQALLAPTGNGLSSVTISGGTGYIAPPIVDIVNGGGTGATAAATIDANGNLTGIIVTNPGTGYNSAPTLTLVGGGGSGATVGSITLNSGNTSGGLTFQGAGTTTLSAANTFSGNILVSAGTLQAATTNLNTLTPTAGPLGNATVARTITINSGATLDLHIGNVLGTGTLAQANVSLVDNGIITNTSGDTNTLGTLTLNGGTLTASSGTSNVNFQTYVFSQPIIVTGTTQSVMSTAGTTNSGFHLGANTAAANITFNVDPNSTGASLLVSAPLIGGSGGVGGGALTKTGPGTMTLSGTNTYTGSTTVSGGVLNVTGAINGNNTANVGQITIGTAANQNALLAITGGTVNASKTSSPSIDIGDGANFVGALNMSSGTLTTGSELHLGVTGYGAMTMSGGTATVPHWFAVGWGGNAALNVSGGTLNVTGDNLTVGTVAGNTNSVVNFSNNGVVNVTNGVYLPEQQNGNVAVLNMSGSAALNISGSAGIDFAQSATAYNNTGILNLDGGTVTTKILQKGAGTGTYLVNFNGGTLKAQTGANAMFLNGLTSAYVYSGNGTIDNNGQTITIGQTLLAPSGNGISASSLTIGGTNSGYIDTPVVTVTGGGGTGATAVANLNYTTGQVTGITITNPGTGYTSAPTLTLLGGGGAATVSGTAALVANTSGGLTFKGAGTTTLSGVNTYGGATTITGGTLRLTNNTAALAYTFATGSAVNTGNNAATVTTTTSGNPSFGTTGGPRPGLGTMTLNGSNYLDISATSLPNLGGLAGNSYTIGMWIKTTTAGGEYLYKGTGWTTGDDSFFLTSGIGNGTGGTGTHVGGVQYAGGWAGGTSNVANGNWNFVSIVRSGGTSTFYVNGAADGTATGMNIAENAAQDIRIGFSSNPGDGAVAFNGSISGVSVYGSALTATQIQALMNNSTGSLPTGTTLQLGASSGSPTLDLNGSYQQVASIADFGGFTNGTITNSATNTPAVLILSPTSGATTYSGVIQDGAGSSTVGLIMNGTGTQTLAGSNSYSGGTILGAGTLIVGNNNALGTGTLTIAGGTTLDASTAGLTLANNPQVWNGNFTFAGTQSLNMGNGAVAMAGSTQVTVSNNTLTLGGAISGSGFGLTKGGTGTLILTGASGYTGGTTISAGTLQIGDGTTGHDGSLAAAGGITDTTSLVFDTFNTQSYAGSISGSGGTLNKIGAGKLTLSGSNSYTGATTVRNGTLNIIGSLANTATTISSGAILMGAGNNSTTGIISGAVSNSAGGGTISLAAGTSSQSLTVNGLTLGNTSAYGAGNYTTLSFGLISGLEVLNVGTAGSSTGVLTVNSGGAFLSIPTGIAVGTYTLANFGSSSTGLSNFSLSSTTAGKTTQTSGFTTYTLLENSTNLQLQVAGTAIPVAYFKGGVSTVWNDASASPTSNWSSNLAGTTDAGNTPGPLTDVILNANTQTGIVSTTLGADTAINSLTVNGNGTNTLAGVNVLTVNAAAINSHTLGDGITVGSAANAFTINAGLALGNTQTWTNASTKLFTVGGNVSGTAVSGTQTLTLAATNTGSITLNGTIGDGNGAGNLALVVNSSGAGVTTLAASNTYTGGTTVSAGLLALNNAAALGTGTLTMAGGNLDALSAITLAANNPQAWNSDFTFVGSNTLNLGNGAVALGANRTVTVSASTLTVGGVISGTNFGLTKAGGGSLVLSGNDTYTGATTITGGVLNLTGTINANNTANVGLVSIGSASKALMTINGGTLNATKNTSPSIDIGDGTNFVGALNMSSGTLNSTSEVHLGQTGYGAMTMTGGTATVGSWFVVGWGGNAVLNVSGGTLGVTGNNLTLGTVVGNGNSVANFSNNAVVNITNGVYLPEQQNGNFAVLNMTGNAALNISGAAGVDFAQSGAAFNNIGILNLDGGTVTTKIIQKGAGTGTYLVNFNGGTLKAQTGATAGFFTGLTNAYVYSGNATIDNNGQTITIGQSLLAPTGNGVSTGGLTIGGTNSGYIDTPVVTITGGGGVGATAVANLNYATGQVTGITITNPGTGYTSAPTFTLFGGGGAATVTGTSALVGNTSGGLTFQGSGATTLSGNNTFTGGVTINAGNLLVGSAGALNSTAGSENAVAFGAGSTGTLSLNGNSVTISNLSTNATPGSTIVQNNNGTNATLTVGNASNLNGAFAGVLQDGITGKLALTKAGGGTLSLTAANTYTGATTITGGTLKLAPVVGTAALAYTFATGSAVNTGNTAATVTTTTSGSPIFTASGGPRAGLGVMTLNGSNYLDILATSGNLPNLGGLSGNSYTIGMWIKTSTPGSEFLYKGSSAWAANDEAFYLTDVTNGNASSGVHQGTHIGGVQYNGGFVGGTANVANGNWNFISIVRSGGTSTFYVNGVADGTATNMNLAEQGTQDIRIGFTNNAGDGPVNFNGSISGVSVYGSALTQAQIQALWNNSTGSLPITTALQLGASSGNATLDLNGVNQQVASLADFGGFHNGVITNSATNTPAMLVLNPTSGATTYSGVIQDGAGSSTVSLAMIGTGTQTLAGASTYTGSTTVASGRLIVTNSSGSATGAGTVTIQGGATLSGSSTAGQGFISGKVNINGGATLGVSGPALTLGNTLALNSNATGAATLTLGLTGTHGAGVNPLINITSGGLNVGGTTNLSLTNAPAVGIWDLISYGAAGVTNPGNFGTISGPATPYTYTVVNNTTNNEIDLAVSGSLSWTGYTNGAPGTPDSNWNTTSTNWAGGGMAVSFANGGVVDAIFNDSNAIGGGNANSTVTIQGTGVTPKSVLFNNSAVNYLVQNASGVTGISGTASVTKSGPGTVFFESSNSYTGGTTITAGVLQVDSDHALGNSGTTRVNGGELLLNNIAYGNTQSLTIAGTGISNAGALASTGNSSFAGAISLSADATIGAAPGSTLTLTGGVAATSAAVTFGGGGTINLSNTGISGQPSSINVINSGTNLVLSVPYSYSGTPNTYITGNATLTLGAGGVLNGTVPNVFVGQTGDTGSVLNLNGHNDSIAGLTLTSGQIAGSGTLTTNGTIVPTGSGNVIGIGATVLGNADDASVVNAGGNSLTVNGTLSGTALLQLASDSLGGTGKVGAIMLNGGTASLSSTGTLTVSGVSSTAITVNSNGNVITGGTIAANALTKLNDTTDLTINSGATLAGTGSVNVLSSSTLTVNSGGAIGGTGNVTVYDTSILVNNGTVAKAVNVLAGGTLSGAGVMNGAVTVTGTVHPGNSPGILTVNNTYTQSTNSFMNFDLGKPTNLGGVAGTDNGLINVLGTTGSNGNLTLGSGVTLNITQNANFGIGTYEIFHYTGTISDGPADANLATWSTNDSSYRYTFSNNTALDEIVLTVASLDSSNFSITTPTVSGGNATLNLLLNLPTGTAARGAVTVTNGGGTSGSYTLTSNSGNLAVTSGGSGTVASGASATATTSFSSTGLTYGSSISGSLTLTGSVSGNTENVTIAGANVGLAAVGANHDFGTPLIGVVSNGETFTGLSSKTARDLGNSGSLGTTATILSSTTFEGTSTTVSESWRTRTSTEAADVPVISDVLSITGIPDGVDYVMQMSYNPADLPSYMIDHQDKLNLGELIGGTWTLAVANDQGGPGMRFTVGWTQSGANLTVGDYGVDTSAHVVWAVLDHDAVFAVIPEPTSLGLLGLGALGLLSRRRKNRA
jgi:fibronectin-binding autotransporter adhesin